MRQVGDTFIGSCEQMIWRERKFGNPKSTTNLYNIYIYICQFYLFIYIYIYICIYIYILNSEFRNSEFGNSDFEVGICNMVGVFFFAFDSVFFFALNLVPKYPLNQQFLGKSTKRGHRQRQKKKPGGLFFVAFCFLALGVAGHAETLLKPLVLQHFRKKEAVAAAPWSLAHARCSHS